MTTVRGHLEAIQDEPNDDTAVYRHVVAALAILNAAERDMFDHETGIVRIVPDYQAGTDQPHHAPGWTTA